MIDRSKLSKVFGFLTTDDGVKSLDSLNAGLESFRKTLPEELDDAEFKYISSALMQQRSNDFGSAQGKPIATSRTSNMAFNLAHGFVVKAKI